MESISLPTSVSNGEEYLPETLPLFPPRPKCIVRPPSAPEGIRPPAIPAAPSVQWLFPEPDISWDQKNPASTHPFLHSVPAFLSERGTLSHRPLPVGNSRRKGGRPVRPGSSEPWFQTAGPAVFPRLPPGHASPKEAFPFAEKSPTPLGPRNAVPYAGLRRHLASCREVQDFLRRASSDHWRYQVPRFPPILRALAQVRGEESPPHPIRLLTSFLPTPVSRKDASSFRQKPGDAPEEPERRDPGPLPSIPPLHEPKLLPFFPTSPKGRRPIRRRYTAQLFPPPPHPGFLSAPHPRKPPPSGEFFPISKPSLNQAEDALPDKGAWIPCWPTVLKPGENAEPLPGLRPPRGPQQPRWAGGQAHQPLSRFYPNTLDLGQ